MNFTGFKRLITLFQTLYKDSPAAKKYNQHGVETLFDIWLENKSLYR